MKKRLWGARVLTLFFSKGRIVCIRDLPIVAGRGNGEDELSADPGSVCIYFLLRRQVMRTATWFAGVMMMCGAGLAGGCASEKQTDFHGMGLIGQWSGESNVVSAKYGFAKGQRTITIKDQQGTEFTGENTWVSSQNGQPMRATEKLIGSYDPATGCVYISEVDDTGLMVGKLLDRDTLEIVYMEAGADATTFRAVLKRQGTAVRK
jgi:hypothetical protein